MSVFRFFMAKDELTHAGPIIGMLFSLETIRLWSILFQCGSVLVPLTFGIIAAATQAGHIPAEPSTVWDSYVQPWTMPFPLCTGLFTVTLFAWTAAVFLAGEVSDEERARLDHGTISTTCRTATRGSRSSIQRAARAAIRPIAIRWTKPPPLT